MSQGTDAAPTCPNDQDFQHVTENINTNEQNEQLIVSASGQDFQHELGI